MRSGSATQLLSIDGYIPIHTCSQITPVAGILFCGNNLLKKRVFPVYNGENRIGRDRSSHIFLPSLNLSRIHACIFFQSGFSFLSDCNSHNGSFRSTLRLTPCFRYELFDGMEFRLGDLSFIYSTDPLNSLPFNSLNHPVLSSLNCLDDDDYTYKIEMQLNSSLPLSDFLKVPIKSGNHINTSNVIDTNSEYSRITSNFLTLEKYIEGYETTQSIFVFDDFDIGRQLYNLPLPSESFNYNTLPLPKSVALVSNIDYIELPIPKPIVDTSTYQESLNPLNDVNSSFFHSGPSDVNEHPVIDTVRNLCHNPTQPLIYGSDFPGDYVDLKWTKSTKEDDLLFDNTFFYIKPSLIYDIYLKNYISKFEDVFPVNFNPPEISPVIIFTFILEDKYRNIISKLGGRITSNVCEATHLITDKVRRTIKFLSCLARGCEILSSDWLTKSKMAGKFLDAKAFRIQDKAAENKYNFVLQSSCEKARSKQLFSGYLFFMTKNLVPMQEEMVKIVYSSGGKIINSLKTHDFPFLLITCEKDLQSVYMTLSDPIPNNVKLISTEFVLTGVLRQSVDFYSFSFFCDNSIMRDCSYLYSKRRKRC